MPLKKKPTLKSKTQTSPNKRKKSDRTIDKIAVENAELRDVLKAQTAELKKKNRELDIESSLEKVRVRTTAMQRSDELGDVAEILFKQVQGLGIQAWTTGFNIWQEGNESYVDWVTNPTGGFMDPYTVDLTTHPVFRAVSDAKKKGEDFHVFDISGEPLQETYRLLISFAPKQFEGILASGIPFPTRQINHYVFGAQVGLMFITPEPCPKAHDIFRRLGKVFEQTYTRFIDLQKAETQAREAQVEASLERVRSKTMAMHNSQDVGESVASMFDELVKLGVETNRCGVLIFSDGNDTEVWTAKSNADGKASLIVGHLDVTIHPMLQGVREAGKKKESFFSYELAGQDISNYYQAINDSKDYPTRFNMDALPSKEFHSDFYFAEGAIFAFTGEPIPTEAAQIFKRFAGVFGQTYRRFLDLQKAEAQAREAKIEASLERVRARAMAMQNSDELNELIGTVFIELTRLDLVLTRCVIMIFDPESQSSRWWMANSEDASHPANYLVKYHEAPPYLAYLEAWRERRVRWRYELQGDVKKNWDDFLFAETELAMLPGFVIQSMKEPDRVFFNVSFNNFGNLTLATLKPLSDEHLDIMLRFAKVFDLTYTRFNDLRQAEIQAREARIEAAMEKVRSQALAMQRPDELLEVAELLRKEMGLLGVEELETSSIYIQNEEAETTQCWYAIKDIRGEDRKLVTDHMTVRLSDTWVGRQMFEFYKSDEKQTSILMQGENRKEWITYCAQHSTVLKGYYGEEIPDRTYHLLKFSNGYMGAASPGAISDESWNLLHRATSVFSFAYTRFLDLQKAEAQAREVTIEAALEKVRGKAMAMHTSNDLSSAASMVFTELRKLGISPIRCGVGLLTKETRKAQLYSATLSAAGDNLALIGWIMLSGHLVQTAIYDNWLKGEDYFPVLSGDEMKSYYKKLLAGLSVPSVPESEEKQYGHFFPLSVGCLYAWAANPYNEAEIKILKRFASIIDLTFRRYIELQKSEANAREAVRQASFDRVRAEIASMRTTRDLERITPLIWKELTILGVPFIRCGVFIMDDQQELIHTFLATPDGKAIAAFHIAYATPGNIRQVVSHWKSNQKYADRWSESDFLDFAEELVKQEALDSTEQYMSTVPAGGFHLHFLPFLQGMLYVGNSDALGEEDLSLLQTVADAFSTAYARYDDFNRLDSAKQQIEQTLTDLKLAQAQLVQSEKMASLGELTAGIAHEIQNPLNFVNNFSEVSNELIDEMMTEVKKGNYEDANAIANDVKQNLEKILHHGKRADGIVKGMLQHSRSSSGTKEPTDINALADEYLRLAYHGLRAKDKSFNAKFETAFDESVGKVNVIPQDIGRVVLNLITNSFYSVAEKRKQQPNGFEPMVVISTKKENGKVFISVKDNGNGIPQKALDKIFQPFFTTKPTGQGTGLGLSMSYDIVKAHGGEFKVETKEGKGAEFIIDLPIV